MNIRFNCVIKKWIRQALPDLLNMNISFPQSYRHIKALPISTFVNVDYTSTVGSVKRKKYKRVITLTSNILSGYTTTTVNQQLANYIQQFKNKPDDVTIITNRRKRTAG